MFRGKKYAQTDIADPKSTSYCPNETGEIWIYNDFKTKENAIHAEDGLELKCTGMIMFLPAAKLAGL